MDQFKNGIKIFVFFKVNNIYNNKLPKAVLA